MTRLNEIINSTSPATVLTQISKLPFSFDMIGKAANLFPLVTNTPNNINHVETLMGFDESVISNVVVILATVTKTDRALAELATRVGQHSNILLYIKKILVMCDLPDSTFKNLMMIVDNIPSILTPLSNALDYITDKDYFIGQIRRAIQHNPDIDWMSALSQGQMRSKFWVTAELKKLDLDLGDTIFVGGWVNILSYLLDQEKLYPTDIISLDIDPDVARLATLINMKQVLDGWRFKAVTYDMMNLTYNDRLPFTNYSGKSMMLQSKPQTIINLSCEHINLSEWIATIPDGTTVILQSNNFDELPEHISCVNSLDTFTNIVGLAEIHYAGELQLEKYTRFMIIGIK